MSTDHDLTVAAQENLRRAAREAGVAYARVAEKVAPLAEAMRRLAEYQATPEFRLYERRRARALARSRRNQAART